MDRAERAHLQQMRLEGDQRMEEEEPADGGHVGEYADGHDNGSNSRTRDGRGDARGGFRDRGSPSHPALTNDESSDGSRAPISKGPAHNFLNAMTLSKFSADMPDHTVRATLPVDEQLNYIGNEARTSGRTDDNSQALNGGSEPEDILDGIPAGSNELDTLDHDGEDLLRKKTKRDRRAGARTRPKRKRHDRAEAIANRAEEESQSRREIPAEEEEKEEKLNGDGHRSGGMWIDTTGMPSLAHGNSNGGRQNRRKKAPATSSGANAIVVAVASDVPDPNEISRAEDYEAQRKARAAAVRKKKRETKRAKKAAAIAAGVEGMSLEESDAIFGALDRVHKPDGRAKLPEQDMASTSGGQLNAVAGPGPSTRAYFARAGSGSTAGINIDEELAAAAEYEEDGPMDIKIEEDEDGAAPSAPAEPLKRKRKRDLEDAGDVQSIENGGSTVAKPAERMKKPKGKKVPKDDLQEKLLLRVFASDPAMLKANRVLVNESGGLLSKPMRRNERERLMVLADQAGLEPVTDEDKKEMRLACYRARMMQARQDSLHGGSTGEAGRLAGLSTPVVPLLVEPPRKCLQGMILGKMPIPTEMLGPGFSASGFPVQMPYGGISEMDINLDGPQAGAAGDQAEEPDAPPSLTKKGKQRAQLGGTEGGTCDGLAEMSQSGKSAPTSGHQWIYATRPKKSNGSLSLSDPQTPRVETGVRTPQADAVCATPSEHVDPGAAHSADGSIQEFEAVDDMLMARSGSSGNDTGRNERPPAISAKHNVTVIGSSSTSEQDSPRADPAQQTGSSNGFAQKSKKATATGNGFIPNPNHGQMTHPFRLLDPSTTFSLSFLQSKSEQKKGRRPSSIYLSHAAQGPCVFLDNERDTCRKLIVTDLNGALLLRSEYDRKAEIREQADQRIIYLRPFLGPLLAYLFPSREHFFPPDPWATFVWSSARPHNVAAMVEACYGARADSVSVLSELREEALVAWVNASPEERPGRVLGVWNRDYMGLSVADYGRKAMTSKDLVKIVDHLQSLEDQYTSEAFHQPSPHFDIDLNNMVLLDDSVDKATLQPYNHLPIPDYDHATRQHSMEFFAWMQTEAPQVERTFDGSELDNRQAVQQRANILEAAFGQANVFYQACVADGMRFSPGIDIALIGVLGIMSELEDVARVPAWLAAGGLLPDVSHTFTSITAARGWHALIEEDLSELTQDVNATAPADRVPPGPRPPHRPQALFPTSEQYMHWFQDPLVLLYWVRRGMVEAERLWIPLEAGVDVEQWREEQAERRRQEEHRAGLAEQSRRMQQLHRQSGSSQR